MRRTIEAVALMLAAVPTYAQRGYPQIETVYPGAVSRGKTTEVLVSGHFNFRDPVRVVFDSDGIGASITGWKELPEAMGYRKTGFPRHGVTLKVTASVQTRLKVGSRHSCPPWRPGRPVFQEERRKQMAFEMIDCEIRFAKTD